MANKPNPFVESLFLKKFFDIICLTMFFPRFLPVSTHFQLFSGHRRLIISDSG